MGASLLAKAVDQSTFMSTDTALSRAGSLPHVFCCGGHTGCSGIVSSTRKPSGRLSKCSVQPQR
ncbi:hypothetical protein C1X64_17335 [Pseudomonas sp. GW456-E7]|nr:hypothetical protein C1X64_17335 [Pseudomonas sp. GW456-E7]